ncbi:MAG: YfhO family protein [Desulfobacterota bacterium]|nr:YfhO family protein [Thermodesulfobacteriota bacterium]
MAGLLLLATAILFFCDLLVERSLLTERDLAAYFIPPRFFWVESLKRFDFPLWNPHQFTGHPFLANPQHGLLYPLNILLLILPFDIGFNTVIVLHFFLAGWFTYFLMKEWGGSFTASLISGFTFMLGGYLLSVHSLLNILLSVTWTPLILLFFRRTMRSFGFKNVLFTAALMTVSFLGGGLEVVYGNFFVLFLVMILLPPVSSHPFGKKGKALFSLYLHRLKFFSALTLAFLFFSAIQLIPFLELWMHSIRGQGITYQEATIWSFAPKDILLFFLPDAYGYFLDMQKYWSVQCWLKTMYTGGLPFILTGLFFVFGSQRKLFLALMIFSLFLALGQFNPLYPWVYGYLPFFNGIRYPVKFLYIFILCLSLTTGLGFDRIRQFSPVGGHPVLKHLLIAFSLVSGLGLLGLVVGHEEVEAFLRAKGVDLPEFNHLSINLHHAKRFLFYLTLFFLLLRVGYETGWKGWVQGLLLLFLVGDLFGNMGFYGKEKTSDYFKTTKVTEIIASDSPSLRVFSTAKTTQMETPVLFVSETPFDVIKETNLPSFSLLYRFHDIWGTDVIRLKRNDDLYRAFIGLPSISASNLPLLYGIRYIVSVTFIEDPDYELVYARLEGLEGRREDLLKQNTIKLYRYKPPVQRAWFVKEFEVMDPQGLLATLLTKEFSPLRKVLLEDPLLWEKVPPGPGAGGGKVEILQETNNRLSLRAETKEEVFLVLSDTYFPGWKVYVNGREERILRANYHFRAVPLTKGTHRIDFLYDPLSFKLGITLTFLGIMGALNLAFYFKQRRCPQEGGGRDETLDHHPGI